MRGSGSYRFWEVRRPYGVAVRVGLVTAGVILLFGMINTLVIYRYVKLDLYLCLVAVFFLAVGLLWNRRKAAIDRRGNETIVSEGASNRGGTIEIGATGLDPLPASVTTDGSDSIALLSAKEWQILKLVAEGKTNKEIAAVQFVEVSTVKTHLNNIYGKLSVNNRKEARAKYAEFAPKWPVMG